MQSGVERRMRIMDDLNIKMRRILVVMLFVCIGIIIICLLDPTQSSGKTFCLCVSSISVAQCLMLLHLLK